MLGIGRGAKMNLIENTEIYKHKLFPGIYSLPVTYTKCCVGEKNLNLNWRVGRQ